ncbi:MAG: sensor domain-containing diguanylate cyclase [Thiogranum sp.]
MDWLQRHRLIAIAVILGIGMMSAYALRHVVSYPDRDWLAELSSLKALELGMLISFLVMPILFGLYAHSLLRRAQLPHLTEEIAEHCETEELLNLTTAVFESTDQGVIIIDREHRIVSVNPAFITLTGYTLDEVKGKSLLFLISSRHNEAFYENIWRLLENKGYWKGDIWSIRKNGETYPSWHTISPIYDSDTGKLTHFVSIFSDITPIKRQQANVDLLAYHDPLTSLPNRLLLTERLEHALSVLTRLNTQVALLFFDLDGFKEVNDTLGHTAGDSLLQVVAGRMQSVLRDGDTVARFGGDEFVILTESCESRAGLERVAEKIIEEISQPVLVEGQKIVVETSIGIAIGPADGTDSQTLIQSADKAMYRAKTYKGSHYCFYDETTSPRCQPELVS